MKNIDVNELKKVLRYEPETGKWFSVKSGKEVGSVQGSYVRLRYRGTIYQSHRLAWFYVHGVWPIGLLDHINGDKTDNRFDNLRNITQRENTSNKKCHREGHLVGTTYIKRVNKWIACIHVNGKSKHLGYFNTQLEAHEAYNRALAELNNKETEV